MTYSKYCFVDTSSWFVLLVPSDPMHIATINVLKPYDSRLLTTDYILDELLSLLKTRGQYARAPRAWQFLHTRHSVTLLHLTEDELDGAWSIFDRFSDKAWSFTDCTSKHVIDSYRIEVACSLDHHFRQFGNVLIIPT